MYNVVLFILSVVIWTPLELQLMAGDERLCHIFERGREMKKAGNHWFRLNFVKNLCLNYY